ncbi:MAG: IspD/TarI family cytidylyltransferase [Planctomycetota bacterium]
MGLAIAAAGSSRRFGGHDKLSQDLGGRPLLLRTIESFTKRAEVTAIVVAAPPDDLDGFRFRYGDQLGFHGAKIVAGGRIDRWETVKNAIAELPEDCTHIAIHDAARPGVSEDLLDRLFKAAERLDAVVPGIPVHGTIKRVNQSQDSAVRVSDRDPIADRLLGGGDDGDIADNAQGVAEQDAARPIVETIDRTGVVEIQTPQIFRAALLRAAFEALDADDAADITDDAMVIERYGDGGHVVHVVEGDPANLKVTRPSDLRLLRAIRGFRPPAERATPKRF